MSPKMIELVCFAFLGAVFTSLVIPASLLYLAGRLLHIANVSYKRAIGMILVIFMLQIFIVGTVLALGNYRSPAIDLMFIVVSVLFPISFMIWLLHTSLSRAILAYLITIPGSMIFSIPLALLFRYFLFEAFFVPTGAMAPTIFGAHADVTCENCSFLYSVSMSEWTGPRKGSERTPVASLCLNCGQTNRLSAAAPILDGDRVLVDKTDRFNRWDLIVFKYPEDPQQIFVKRLVGIPNEKLEIFDGDIFINDWRLQKEPGEAPDMWLFQHDTSFVPKNRLDEGPRWEPAVQASHWQELPGGKWAFTGKDVEAETLDFTGHITDLLSYNGESEDPVLPGRSDIVLENNVDAALPTGDIKVECWIEQFAGDGGLKFLWEYGNRKVTASVTSSGDVKISASTSSTMPRTDSDEKLQEEATSEASAKLPLTGHRLTFAFRDGQAYVARDDTTLVTLQVGPQDLKTQKEMPAQNANRCTLAVSAEKCDLVFSRICLWKDVYYRTFEDEFGEKKWGNSTRPAIMGVNEFFTMGDNSARSKDSRFWGMVAKDAVIGVARWRYWPFTRWAEFH
jgi:signal peptidase I